MNLNTGIEWTDATSNPIRYRDKSTGQDVWACVKISPGCKGCYAEALALRFGKGGPFTKAEMAKVEPYLCEKELHRLLTAKKLAGKKVFIGDMTDVFGEWVPDVLLDRLFAVIALRPDVTFQVLTKRAERMAAYLSDPGRADRIDDACSLLDWRRFPTGAMPWPLPNVWLGVSVEDSRHGLPRIDHLRAAPVAVRFLSVEPLLEGLGQLDLTGIDWVIIGCESGPRRRPMAEDWARDLVEQCDRGGIACFVKQLEINGRVAGDVSQFVPQLQVREYPIGQFSEVRS